MTSELPPFKIPTFSSSVGISSTGTSLGKRYESPVVYKLQDLEKKQRRSLEDYTSIQTPPINSEASDRLALNLQREKFRLSNLDLINVMNTQGYGASSSQFAQQLQLQLLSDMNQYQQMIRNLSFLNENTMSNQMAQYKEKLDIETKVKTELSPLKKVDVEDQSVTDAPSEKSTHLETTTQEETVSEKELKPEMVKINVDEEQEEEEKKVYEEVEEPALFVLTKKFPGWNLCTICNFLNSGRAEKDFNIFENVHTRKVRSCRVKNELQKEEEIPKQQKQKKKQQINEPIKQEEIHAKLEDLSDYN